jgi:hypothetical protein
MSRRIAPLAVLFAFTVALPCLADEQAVEFRPGGAAFGAHFMPGAWMQRTVTVSNPTDSFKHVKISGVANLPSRGETHFSRAIRVPPRSVRTTDIAMIGGIPGQTLGNTAGARVQHQEDYILYNADNGARLARGFGMALKIEPDSFVVGTVRGRDLKEDDSSFLAPDVRKTRPTPFGGEVAFVTSSQQSLPGRWYGYSMVRMLLCMEADFGTLRPSQRQAIIDWVRRGGVLLISSPTTMRSLPAEISTLAGVEAGETFYIEALAVDGVNGKSVKADLGKPMPMVALMPLTAQVVLEHDNLPLLTRQSQGLGAVYTLATPVAAMQDPGLAPVWAFIRESCNRKPAISTEDFVHDDPAMESSSLITTVSQRASGLKGAPRQEALDLLDDMKAYMAPGKSALSSIAGRRGPGRIVPVSILLALAALVGLAGLLLRLKRRGELLWLFLVPISIAGGFAFHFAAGLSSDRARLSYVGVITGLGDDSVRVQELYQFYSGPDGRSVTFQSPSGVISPIGGVSSSVLSLSEIHTGAGVSLNNLQLHPNDTTGVYVDDVQGGRRFSPRLSFGGAGLAGVIDNELGFSISNAVIMTNRRTYKIGDISSGRSNLLVRRQDMLSPVEVVNLNERASMLQSAGGRVAARAPREPRGEPAARRNLSMIYTSGDFTGSLVHDRLDAIRSRLIGGMIPFSRRTPRNSSPTLGGIEGDCGADARPVLIGYAQANLADPLADDSVERQGWCAVIWPLDIVSPAPGEKVSIPSGFSRVSFEASPLYNSISEKFSVVTNDGGMRMTVSPPPGISLENPTIGLEVNVQARTCRVTIVGLPPASQKQAHNLRRLDGVVLQTFDRPDGLVRLEIENAERFATPEGGYAIGICMERINDSNALDNMIRSIEVDLEGTVR